MRHGELETRAPATEEAAIHHPSHWLRLMTWKPNGVSTGSEI